MSKMSKKEEREYVKYVISAAQRRDLLNDISDICGEKGFYSMAFQGNKLVLSSESEQSEDIKTKISQIMASSPLNPKFEVEYVVAPVPESWRNLREQHKHEGYRKYSHGQIYDEIQRISVNTFHSVTFKQGRIILRSSVDPPEDLKARIREITDRYGLQVEYEVEP